MNTFRHLAAVLTVCSCSLAAHAADYALSPDGTAVVRLVAQGSAAAGSLDSALLPAGWTAATAAGGTTSINSYTAGFSGTTGGAEITALFDGGAAVPAGSYLEWVQVLNTNSPLGGNTSPYLDNAADTSKPFYSLTAQNLTAGLPAGQIDFYDFSKRDPALLATTDPITWNASLYPVVANAANQLEVHDGVTWGWTMKKAPVGTVAATFTDPAPGSAVVSGVGTSTFRWGTGDPSSLSFAASAFDATPGTPFKLGTLTFHNGAIPAGTGANAVTFNTALHFTNVPELDFTLSTMFGLVNTPNTDDPIASADQVTIGNFGFTFNVLEGATASADIMAVLSTGLVGTPAGTSAGATLRGSSPVDAPASFMLTIVGLTDVTDGGFVTGVPEPAPAGLLAFALVLLVARRFQPGPRTRTR